MSEDEEYCGKDSLGHDEMLNAKQIRNMTMD